MQYVSLQLQAYGFVEVFAGEAWCSKMMRMQGIATASFDIRYRPEPPPAPGKQNYMDIRSSAGFSLLGCMCRFCRRSRSMMLMRHWLRLILLSILNMKFDEAFALWVGVQLFRLHIESHPHEGTVGSRRP